MKKRNEDGNVGPPGNFLIQWNMVIFLFVQLDEPEKHDE